MRRTDTFQTFMAGAYFAILLASIVGLGQRAQLGAGLVGGVLALMVLARHASTTDGKSGPGMNEK